MTVRTTLFLPLALAIALVGCNKTDQAAPAAPVAASTAVAPAATSTASANSASPAMAPVAAAADSVGVAECDDYIAKVRACVASKVPEAQRSQMESAFKAQSDAFRQAAANPQAKAMLATQCKAAMDQAKTAYAAYGCSM
ncbi:hypothetical protein [Rhodanobacter sp. L36]|uniref:hypothetical protein n=1 Tax=Rhodanobacter sp. L36 TaxID=1747221 RepID=UPI00131BE92E|nr:hypothetical protein [Rhodanobacter sp. L36]